MKNRDLFVKTKIKVNEEVCQPLFCVSDGWCGGRQDKQERQERQVRQDGHDRQDSGKMKNIKNDDEDK